MSIRTPQMPNMHVARVARETSANFSAWRAGHRQPRDLQIVSGAHSPRKSSEHRLTGPEWCTHPSGTKWMHLSHLSLPTASIQWAQGRECKGASVWIPNWSPFAFPALCLIDLFAQIEPKHLFQVLVAGTFSILLIKRLARSLILRLQTIVCNLKIKDLASLHRFYAAKDDKHHHKMEVSTNALPTSTDQSSSWWFPLLPLPILLHLIAVGRKWSSVTAGELFRRDLGWSVAWLSASLRFTCFTSHSKTAQVTGQLLGFQEVDLQLVRCLCMFMLFSLVRATRRATWQHATQVTRNPASRQPMDPVQPMNHRDPAGLQDHSNSKCSVQCGSSRICTHLAAEQAIHLRASIIGTMTKPIPNASEKNYCTYQQNSRNIIICLQHGLLWSTPLSMPTKNIAWIGLPNKSIVCMQLLGQQIWSDSCAINLHFGLVRSIGLVWTG